MALDNYSGNPGNASDMDAWTGPQGSVGAESNPIMNPDGTPAYFTGGSTVESVSDRNIIISVKNSDKFQAIYNGGNIATQVSGGQVYIRSSIIDTANISVLAAEELLLNGNTSGVVTAGNTSTADNTIDDDDDDVDNTGGNGGTGNQINTDFVGYLESSETLMSYNKSLEDYNTYDINNGSWSDLQYLDFNHAEPVVGQNNFYDPANLTHAQNGGYRVPADGDYRVEYKLRVEVPYMFFLANDTNPQGYNIPEDGIVQAIGVNDVWVASKFHPGDQVISDSLFSNLPLGWIASSLGIINWGFDSTNGGVWDRAKTLDYVWTQVIPNLSEGDEIKVKIGWYQGYSEPGVAEGVNPTRTKSFSHARSRYPVVPIEPRYSWSRLSIQQN